MNKIITISVTVGIFALLLGGLLYFQGERSLLLKVLPETILTVSEREAVDIQTLRDVDAASGDIHAMEQANNQFALRLYADLKAEEGNVFFSPYSISIALALLYEGAQGKTAEEMHSVLQVPKEAETRLPAVRAIFERLNSEDSDYELRTANSLWIQEDYEILPRFFAIADQFFGAATRNVDFKLATEEAREAINAWVAEKTNDIIDELFSRRALSSDARLVIANAIYFKGDWVYPFDEENTQDAEFRVNEEQSVEIPLMRQSELHYYYEDDDVQALEMFYEGEHISMFALLPKDEDLSALEERLTGENLSRWKEGLRRQRVVVYFPKFEFDVSYSLNDSLKRLGMPTAFEQPWGEGGADFTGVTDRRELFIGALEHKAFVSVDEEGTEAAAVTGIGGGPVSVPPPPKVFRADRPFLFILQEQESGHILFMGRVVDPT